MSNEQPEQTDGKREALLKAARDLFLKNTYGNISIRRIAERAKVNSAMIAYYFGSKSGLFREMIRSYLGINLRMAEKSAGQLNQITIEDFMIHFYQTVPSELTHLAIRTMIYERSDMRDWLLENLMQPAFQIATKIAVTIVDDSGKPVDPIVFRTMLQGMLVFPKLIQPILNEFHPGEIDDEFYRKMAKLNSAVIAEFFNMEKH